MRHPFSALVARLGLGLGLTLVGCSGRDVARDAGDSARSLVRVEVTYTRGASSNLRFDAQAHFVRYRAFGPSGVPTLLGVPADLDNVPVGTCRLADGTAELDQALASDGTDHELPAEVSLLDAGRLEVKTAGDRTLLLPHHYPELVPFVSGVVYGGDEIAPVELALGQLYQVSGDGGEEVGPFIASVVAPSAFPSLAAEPLRRGSDLNVRWSDAASDPIRQDPLLLELKWSGRNGARAVRCRVRDDGSFSLPHQTFDALLARGNPGSATLTASRIRRAPLLAPGAGRGEFLIGLQDIVPLPVSP